MATPWDPTGVSGVASDAWQPGVPIQTGLAGPSQASAYADPVYDASTGQQYTGTIPAGTWVTIGQPPQMTDTGIAWAQLAAQREQALLNAQNQAQQNANQYAIGVAQVEATYAQTAEQLKAAEANYAVQSAQIQATFANDVAQFGLQKAQDLYQARLSQAQLALQTAQAQQQNAAFQLQVAQANAQQRQAQASNYQSALQMMANRTGPQDEIAYQRLVAGIGAPTPTNSTTLDPFAYIKNEYQPINIPSVPIPQAPTDIGQSAIAAVAPPQAPNIPAFDFGSVPTPTISPTQPSVSIGGGTASGGTTSGGTSTPSTATTPANNMDVSIYGQNKLPGEGGTPLYGGVGIPNTAVNWLQPGQTVNLYTGAGGPFQTNSLGAGYGLSYNGNLYTNQSPAMTVPGDAAVAVYRMATGGQLHGGAMALVGDGPGKTPSPNAELAQALVDQAGRPVLKVTPPDETRSIIDSGGLPVPAINGLTVPRMDTGGTVSDGASYGSTGAGVANPYGNIPGVASQTPPDYGGNGSNGTYGTALNYPTMTFNQYSPSVLGSQPFYQQLTGASQSRPFGAFGANISNPQLGIYNAPMGINYRTYQYLNPSQQQGFQSLYGQGLGINPADVIQQAQNAAPQGMYYGYVPLVASHYGG